MALAIGAGFGAGAGAVLAHPANTAILRILVNTRFLIMGFSVAVGPDNIIGQGNRQFLRLIKVPGGIFFVGNSLKNLR
ncbi:hypothetical protein [Massilia eurypsychrophila]|uniref:hypothetical protein n=1 Tax=Massilia eurypsychrophila TaxID=1485217 RepID=UPI001034D71A|nr:hypothetical protein [Massilia eurypsychrophila]